jgi:hypothetical protein
MREKTKSFFNRLLTPLHYFSERIPILKSQKFRKITSISCTTIVIVSSLSFVATQLTYSNQDDIRNISQEHPDGVKNPHYLDLKIPENTNVEQGNNITIEAFGNNWFN